MALPPLRIALVAHYFPAGGVLPTSRIDNPPAAGGHPFTWTRTLAESLVVAGAEVHVVTDSKAVRRVVRHAVNGVTYHFLPDDPHLLPQEPSLYAESVWRCRRYLRQIVRPSIVQGQGTESKNGWCAVHSGLPAIVMLQGLWRDFHPYSERQSFKDRYRIPLGRLCEFLTLRRARYAIGKTLFNTRSALIVNPALRTTVIENVIDSGYFSVTPDFIRNRIGLVGTLCTIKGSDLLPDLVRRLPPETEMDVFGDGPLRSSLEHALAGESRIRFHGHRDGPVLREAMQSWRCLLHLARMDSSPNVVAEAHAAGLPVVAFSVGGIPEMVTEGTDGFLAAPDNTTALANRTVLLLREPDTARRMGEAGRRRVRSSHDPAGVAHRVLAFYRLVLSESNRSHPVP